jgi:peptide/nickel transport system substrate-binding protein
MEDKSLPRASLTHHILNSALNRREVLRRALSLGISAPILTSLLAACGDEDDGEDTTDTTDEEEEPAAEEPTEEDGDETEEPTEEQDDESAEDSGGEQSDDREFRIAFYGGIPDQDPQSAYDSLASSLFLATYEMLIRLDGESTFEYQPMLAQEWESNEELTEYTFVIPDNAMFHDGTVCDAEAVKRSFVRFHQMGRGPVSVINRFIDDPEEQIEAVDEVTVRFIMNKPEPLFLPAMASSYGPFVVSPTAWEENATDDDPYAHNYFSQNMIGTGPYMVTEAEPQERFILDRFEDYHSEAPFFDRITARVVPEDPTRRSLVE